MPELVYNVRFQLDTTGVEKIKDPISDSAKASMEAYQNEIAELQGKIDTLSGVVERSGNSSKKAAEDTQKLAQSQNQASSSSDKLKNTFFNQMANVNKLTAELVSTRAEFQRLASTQNLSAEATERFKEDVLSLSSAVDEESRKLRELGASLKLSNNQQAAMFRTVTGGENAIRTARSQLESYEIAMKRSTQTVDAATQKFLEEQGAVQRSTSELRQKISALEKLVASGNASNEALERMSNEIMEFAISAERSGAELQEMAGKLDLTDGQAKQLATTLSSLNRAQVLASRRAGAVNQQLTGMSNSIAGTNRQAGLMNKQFSGANQTLFSFSDLIQDSTQFQYGFATGMRAIGNNIGFTAELIAVTAANVQKYNAEVAAGNIAGAKQVTVLGALRQSLTGVGGIVLGINLAVTAISILSEQFGKSRKHVSAATSALDEYVGIIADMRVLGEDVFGVARLEEQSKALQDMLSNLGELPDEAQKLIVQIARAESRMYSFQRPFPSFVDPFNIAGLFELEQGFKELDETIGEADFEKKLQGLKDELQEVTEAAGQFVDDQGNVIFSQKIIEKALEETNIELAKKKVLYNTMPLLEYRDDLSAIIEELQIFNKAGVDNSETIEDLRDALITLRASWLDMPKETKDRAFMVDLLNKSIESLNGTLDGSSGAVDDFGKVLDDLSARSLNLMTQIGILRTELSDGSGIAEARKNFMDYISSTEDLEEHLKSSNDEVKGLAQQIIQQSDRLFAIQSQLNVQQIVDSFTENEESIDSINKKYDEAIKTIQAYNGYVLDGIEGIDEYTQSLNNLRQQELLSFGVDKIISDINDTVDAIRVFSEAGIDNRNVVDGLIAKYEEERDAIAQNAYLYPRAADQVAAYNAAIKALSGLYDDVTPKTKTFFDTLKERTLLASVFGDEDDIRDFIRTLEDQIEALKRTASITISSTGGINTVGDASVESAEKVKALESAINSLMSLLNDGGSGATKSTRDYAKEIRALTTSLKILSTEIVTGSADMSGIASEVLTFTNNVDDLEAELQALQGSTDSGAENTRNQIKQLIRLEKELFAASTNLIGSDVLSAFSFGEPKTELELFNEELERAQDILDTLRSVRVTFNMPTDDIDEFIEKLKQAGIEFNNLSQEQEKLARNQKTLNDLQAGIRLANAVGQLGEVFEASKKFQYAMAVIAGSLAVISAFGDKNFTTFGRFANAAAVAAAVAVQIKQIKDTEIGGASSFQQPTSTFGAGSSMTEVAPPQQNISFTPTANGDGMTLNITNEVVATPKGLAIITRNGEREIANSQKSVR